MAAEAVASHKAERGILVCGTGIGMSIVANKVKGVRAALCHDHFTAVMSRRHNDANVLVLARACSAQTSPPTWSRRGSPSPSRAAATSKAREDKRLRERELERHRVGSRRRTHRRHRPPARAPQARPHAQQGDLVEGLPRPRAGSGRPHGLRVTRHLPLEEVEIETPVAKTELLHALRQEARDSPRPARGPRHGRGHPQARA